ncbi:MAG: sigma-70 family RNA polymerase sigma factor [Bacteroidota bacterium]|nr:sigma-70 family RNA polymerase sigma factor [Bacteroidota bacterium]
MSNKSKLIKKSLNGEKKALNKLFTIYAGEFLSICMRYARNKSHAEDILQEAFIKIYTKIDSFNNKGSFEGWMKRAILKLLIHTTMIIKATSIRPKYKIING